MANVVPVVHTMPADLLTPLAVYLKLADANANSFLLESVEGGETLARYSFIGVEPEFTVTGNNSFVFIVTDQASKRSRLPFLNFYEIILVGSSLRMTVRCRVLREEPSER